MVATPFASTLTCALPTFTVTIGTAPYPTTTFATFSLACIPFSLAATSTASLPVASAEDAAISATATSTSPATTAAEAAT